MGFSGHNGRFQIVVAMYLVRFRKLETRLGLVLISIAMLYIPCGVGEFERPFEPVLWLVTFGYAREQSESRHRSDRFERILAISPLCEL